MTVFSLSIKFLKDHLFNSLSDNFSDIQKDDIHYVLTVPAIWDDNAKQFMREAAVKASPYYIYPCYVTHNLFGNT